MRVMSTTPARQTFTGRHIDLAKLFNEKLPQAIEAECALLGSMILDWRVVGEVVQILETGDDFYEKKHGALYQVLVQMYDQHQSLDMVQLKHRLDDLSLLDQVGGVEYLVELAESVPSATSAAHYARIVRDKAVLRRLIDAERKAGGDRHAAQALLNLGNIELAAGNLPQAEAVLRRALAREPDFRDAQNNLAWVLYKCGGDLDEAERLARSAAAEQRLRPYALDTLAAILESRGKTAQAADIRRQINTTALKLSAETKVESERK